MPARSTEKICFLQRKVLKYYQTYVRVIVWN